MAEEIKRLLSLFFLDKFFDKFIEHGFLHPRFIAMMTEKDIEKFKKMTKMKFAEQIALTKLLEYCSKKFPCNLNLSKILGPSPMEETVSNSHIESKNEQTDNPVSVPLIFSEQPTEPTDAENELRRPLSKTQSVDNESVAILESAKRILKEDCTQALMDQKIDPNDDSRLQIASSSIVQLGNISLDPMIPRTTLTSSTLPSMGLKGSGPVENASKRLKSSIIGEKEESGSEGEEKESLEDLRQRISTYFRVWNLDPDIITKLTAHSELIEEDDKIKWKCSCGKKVTCHKEHQRRRRRIQPVKEHLQKKCPIIHKIPLKQSQFIQ